MPFGCAGATLTLPACENEYPFYSERLGKQISGVYSISGRMLIVISSDGRQKVYRWVVSSPSPGASVTEPIWKPQSLCSARLNLTIGTGPLPLIQESPGAATNITLVDRSGGHAGDNPARRRVALRRANQL